MDQMLEKLAGQAYYCFLDGYSGNNQIVASKRHQLLLTQYSANTPTLRDTNSGKQDH
jgi:hypothetical protein